MKQETIVIKLGTNTIFDKSGNLIYQNFQHISESIKSLVSQDYKIILVCSGAKAGYRYLVANEDLNDLGPASKL